MKVTIVALTLVASVAMAAEPGAHADSLENLTLDQALGMAESLQPELAEAKAMIEAAESRAAQAGAFPNPEAIAGAQQIPFSGGRENEKEYVAGISQPIPLSRRLSKARQAELLDAEVKARGLEVKRRNMRKRVHSAFATALYQESAFLAQKTIVENSRRAVAAAEARLSVGDGLPEELARVEIELARARAELNRAESLREQAFVSLTSAMGNAQLKVHSLAGTLEAALEIPAIEHLAANLSSAPELAQAEADIRARAARIDVVQAERIPDIKVQLLYHRLEGSGQNAFDFGVSLPLPLFGQNRSRLREARAEAAASEARYQSVHNDLIAKLRESQFRLSAALENSRILKAEILPKAEMVLKGAEARYAAGDISLTEILPLRRDWGAIKLSYLESLRDVMQAWVELRSLTQPAAPGNSAPGL